METYLEKLENCERRYKRILYISDRELKYYVRVFIKKLEVFSSKVAF